MHCKPRQLLGHFLRLGVDRFRWRAIKGNAVVVGKHGSAVDRRHLPGGDQAERVWNRPAYGSGNLADRAHCQRADLVRLDRESDRPFLPKHCKLPGGFLGAAGPLDSVLRCHPALPL
jgi:hypothetical protein